jgi:hypothetical protein
MDRNRVHYYSQYDLSIEWNLQQIEELLQDFDASGFIKDLNDIIELYHIKKHIDYGNHLLTWNENYINNLKSTVNTFPRIIVMYLRRLSNEALYDQYKLLDWGYIESFWEIISHYDILDLLDEAFLNNVLSEEGNLRPILQQEKIVNRFGTCLRNKMMFNNLSAHILLDQYVRKGLNDSGKTYFFPSSLTIEDKEDIIVRFLNQDEPNLNYVRLVRQVKDSSNQIILTPRTRLLAESVEENLTNRLLDKANVIHSSYSIAYDRSENVPPTRIEPSEDGFMLIHSWKYIEGLNKTQKILVFGYLFGMIGEDWIISLVNKDYETGCLESVLASMDHSKNAYFRNWSCHFNNNLALGNTTLYSQVLPSMGERLESLVKSFYESHFKEDYGYTTLPLTLPEEDADWIAKCRTIMPELDSVSKQYDLFIKEEDLDPRLFQFEKPSLTTDVKSLFENKYYEINGSPMELWEPMCFLYKMGEVLHVVNGFDTTGIENFHDFITRYEVPYSVYTDFRKGKIDKLISSGYIKVDEQGILRLANVPAIKILGCLWRNRAISYWHHDKPIRELLDEWKNEGLLKTDDHLLCESERNLFSYYLNKSQYTNGPDIRNRYAHGSIPAGGDMNIHAKNYYTLMMLLILLLLKIEDEFRIGLFIVQENIPIKNE